MSFWREVELHIIERIRRVRNRIELDVVLFCNVSRNKERPEQPVKCE